MSKKVFLILCIVGIPIITVLLYVYFPWVILPINSSPRMLTLVDNGGPNLKRITMKRYINELLVDEYELDLKIELRHQQPQKYVLPEVNEGQVECIVELENGITHENKNVLVVKYPDASKLHGSGLLIYLVTDFESLTYIDGFVCYDQFVCFISGEEKTVFIEDVDSSKWELTTDAPLPERFARQTMGYSPLYYGWKENKWEKKIVEQMGTCLILHIFKTRGRFSCPDL